MHEQTLAIVKRMHSGAVSTFEGSKELQAVDPDHLLPYIFFVEERANVGDLQGAEEIAWQGLTRGPCSDGFYLAIGKARTSRDENDPVGRVMSGIGFRKHATANKDKKLILTALSTTIDAEAELAEQPAEIVDRIRPLLILQKLQEQALKGVEPAVLDYIRKYADLCVPVFRSALREWARVPGDFPDEAVWLLAALLGEFAGVDAVADLLELSATESDDLYLHVQWGLWRLGQRFPAETLARFHTALPGSSLDIRCQVADHLSLLPGTVEISEAADELVASLRDFADHEDAPYVVKAAAWALGNRGGDEAAERILALSDAILSAKNLECVRDHMDDFVPNIVREELPDLDVNDVVLYGALENEEDEDAEYVPAPRVVPIRPGRNDLCWCGSGKKYKKCHLTADEEAGR
jgi:hypothetical protein